MEMINEKKNGGLVIGLAGEIDASNAEELKTHFLNAMKDHRGTFVIDMAGVRFIDSSGLGVLVGFYKNVRVGEGDVRLASLQDPISKIFTLTKLDRVFGIFGDVPSALAS